MEIEILNGQDFFDGEKLMGKRPMMTIRDSDFHPDDHFESHLSRNGL